MPLEDLILKGQSSRSQVKFLFLGGPEFDLDKSWRVYGFKYMNNVRTGTIY